MKRPLAPLLVALGAAACFDSGNRTDDATAPALLSTFPADAATGVPTGAAIAATFSEPIDPKTATAGSFTVSKGTSPLAGLITVADATAVFAPATPLEPNTRYTVTIAKSVADLAGNTLAEGYTWTFRTGAAPDLTGPMVVRTLPDDGAEEVPVTAVLKVTFSEALDPLTVAADTFVVRAGETAVDGAVTVSGTSATFAPLAPLSAATQYVATLTPDIRDTAGNPLSGGHTWSFRTVDTVDTSPPTVIATSPSAGATEVPETAALRITFSEPMDVATLNAASITLTDGVTFVAGTIDRAADVAVFAPVAPLARSTRYTAVVDVGATDVQGNPLASRHVWTFTTAPTRSDQAPSVTSTTPATGANGVSLATSVRAIFSRPMNEATLNVASFTLARGETVLAATVTAAGDTAILTPLRPLDPLTSYTATITTAARDLAGVALGQPRVWTFMTGPAPDLTPPTVTQTSPAADAEDVSLTPSITATFNEPLDASTVNAATMVVSARGVPAQGTVSYGGGAARFVPSSTLTPETIYTVTLTVGVKDAAGNALAQPFTWRFTTQRTPDFTPPAVSATSPSPAATGVPVTSAVVVTFSEAIDPSTLTPVSLTLSKDSNPVAASVYAAGRTAVLAPTASLDYGTTYVVTVWNSVTDVAGNPLPQNHNWFFSTAPRPDTTGPWIVSTTPSPGQQGAGVNGTVTAVFSEAVDPQSVSPVTFTLTRTDGQVAGSVSVSGASAVFTPTAPLATNTRYTATVFASVRDLAGNPMNGGYSWSFVTAP